MIIEIFTLFPEMFNVPLQASILGRAIERGLLQINLHNIRDYAIDRHSTVDDYAYGGGPGMVLKPEPLFQAVDSVLGKNPKCPIVLLTPQGNVFKQSIAVRFSKMDKIAFICGHYEGFDERIREHLATEELSIGDYVLTGGELPAMVVVDAVARLKEGVLGSEESASTDSHFSGLLQYPQYTRPPDFRGWKVPEILLSGNHGAVAKWRQEQSLKRTLKRRPDLHPERPSSDKSD
ncbi:MAG: tRNA (guanine37-N1)-methyltransferase [Chloroflexi bacterium]|jgi:tRNA (guanine37-N1)-methyltransferase|nr:MAG: tRNA (guanine37-N1)-methyltransferase [Chloroflexota bacterium]